MIVFCALFSELNFHSFIDKPHVGDIILRKRAKVLRDIAIS